MGRRGPPPTPVSILAARGSWLAKKRADCPAGDGTPTRPDFLKGEADHAWRVLKPKLAAMGVLARVDQNALARYCQIYSLWRADIDFLAKNGSDYPEKDEGGRTIGLKQFPAVSRCAKYADQLLRLEQQFGLTPSARSSIHMNKEAPASREDGKGRFFAAG